MNEDRNRHPPVPARLKGATWAGQPIESMTREELLVVIDDLQHQVESARRNATQLAELVQLSARRRA